MSLALGGVAIPVSAITESGRHLSGGDYERTSRGNLMDGTRAVRPVYAVTTTFLDPTDYSTVRAAVDLRAEQDVTGDLVDATKGFTSFQGVDHRTARQDGSTVVQRRIRFELLESES